MRLHSGLSMHHLARMCMRTGWLACATMTWAMGSLAQAPIQYLESPIPPDPGAQGYTLDNKELRFTERVVLPKNISTRGGGLVGCSIPFDQFDCRCKWRLLE